MAGKGGIYRFLVLIVAAFAVAGCSPPVAFIGQGINNIRVPGDLFVNPQKKIYDKDAVFYPNEDLKVYIAYEDEEEETQPISPDACEFWYIDVPAKPDAMIRVTMAGIPLNTPGEKDILVRYRTTNSSYSYKYGITVLEATQTHGPINIRWKDPPP